MLLNFKGSIDCLLVGWFFDFFFIIFCGQKIGIFRFLTSLGVNKVFKFQLDISLHIFVNEKSVCLHFFVFDFVCPVYRRRTVELSTLGQQMSSARHNIHRNFLKSYLASLNERKEKYFKVVCRVVQHFLWFSSTLSFCYDV